LLTKDGKRADQLIFLEQRDRDEGASAGEFDKCDARRVSALGVEPLGFDIGNVHQLFRSSEAPKTGFGTPAARLCQQPLGKLGGHAQQCDWSPKIVVIKVHDAEVSLANTSGVLQH